MTFIREVYAGKHIHKSCLAAAVLTEQREYLAFADMATVAERLKGHTSLALAAQTVDKAAKPRRL